MNIDYSPLPEHMRGGWKRYIEKGIRGGSFIDAVVCNDLMGAMGKADDINRENLHSTCSWLYNHAPIGCWGSPDKVKDWIAQGGMQKYATEDASSDPR